MNICPEFCIGYDLIAAWFSGYCLFILPRTGIFMQHSTWVCVFLGSGAEIAN